MFSKSIRSRALQLAGSLALCAVAFAAQADPVSLQGSCHLSSILAGQGRCAIQYSLSDSFATPANIKSAVVRVDNLIVQRYLNDTANPVTGTVPYISGLSEVSCGASHVVTAFMTKLGVGTVQLKVGMLPAVACPIAP